MKDKTFLDMSFQTFFKFCYIIFNLYMTIMLQIIKLILFNKIIYINNLKFIDDICNSFIF